MLYPTGNVAKWSHRVQITDFARAIWTLDPDTPKHKELETLLRIGVGYGDPWYRSQREHWLGWLGDYHTPGAYNRSMKSPSEARAIYNRINCAPMLFWLGEAAGLPNSQLDRAFDAIAEKASGRVASQCGAHRKVVPWADIEAALLKLPPLSDGQIAQTDHDIASARRRLRKKLGLDRKPS